MAMTESTLNNLSSEIKFTFDGELPDLNQYIKAVAKFRTTGGEMKRDATDYIMYESKRQAKRGFITIEVPCFVEFHWYCKDRRKDKDNISSMGRKVILDGFQKADIIAQDSWNAIIGFSDHFYLDAVKPRIEIIIYY